jgi:hypothetical protein
VRWGKERGCYEDSILPNTEAWEAARGQCTGGGASAQNGDSAGAVGDKRRIVGGVGCFTGVGLPFIGAAARRGVEVPSMAGVEGASMSPSLKAPVTREMKRDPTV